MKKLILFLIFAAGLIVILIFALTTSLGDLKGVETREVPEVVKDEAFGGVYVKTEGEPTEYCRVIDVGGKSKFLQVRADDQYMIGYLKARAISDEMISYMETVDKEVTDYAGSLLMHRAKKKSRYYWKAIDDRYRDEITGVYHGLLDEGHDVKAADVLFAYTWRELVYVTLAVRIGPIYYKLFYKDKGKETGGCSSFGILNPDGSVIIAQTIDSPPQSKGFGDYYFEEQRINGEDVVTTMSSYAGLFGWDMGWNSKGVSVVINNMFTKEYAKEPRLPYTFRGREALRIADDAYEYVEHWTKTGSPNAQNFMVTDLKGNLLRLERSREEFVITDVKKDGLKGTYWEDIGMLTSTNTFVTDEMKHLILFPDVCTGRQPTADTTAKKYAADGRVTLIEMKEILAYQPEGEITDENAICYRPQHLIEKNNASITVYQLIFAVEDGVRKIYLKENLDCGDKDYVSPVDPLSR
ncbi:MAG: hypothetical protein JW984_07850 [Deltaproteobacteria bacterium]|uniref:Uncharacterized protein n=1 Tax=Candidatus Zymogenus saltonus TaxID=2844893 RepID=A0A9D8PPE2_9DELT|nr:hypothetical protein [Candidatus Zymogenus saltonus]